MASRIQETSATNTPIRSRSPDISHSPGPFSNQHALRSPSTTRPSSHRASTTGFNLGGGGMRYFQSRRIGNEEIKKPWLQTKDPKAKWHRIFPIGGMIMGLIFTGLLCYQGYKSVINYGYCPVYVSDWSSGRLEDKIWTRESEVGGFGNGQFEQSTTTDENAFIKDGELWIKPTLQDPSLMTGHHVLNLTKEGTCTGQYWYDCVATTNSTNGTVINPVKSARINTKKGATIQYGRLEVVAKLPAGDWLWPAIWMLPVKSTYGDWPASGEIDIAESRGNNFTYAPGGNNIASSAIHWGPSPDQDAWYHTFSKKTALHTTYAAKYHTFGLEWSAKYLFTYVDSRLLEALYIPFDGPLWKKGNFAASTENGTRIVDPWSQTGRASTPFDQEFYLILNVAVGSTNGWWTDGYASKPWVDASPTAKRDFWNSRDTWYPTWKDGGQMQIQSVKMWQQSGFKGCTGSKKMKK